MKKIFAYFLLLLFCAVVNAQDFGQSAYSIDGEEVVYTFDVRSWHEGLKDKASTHQDFKDYDIAAIISAGQINTWTSDGWVLKKVDGNIYQLRKKLDDFDAAASQQLKYLIDGEYWAYPSSEPTTSTNPLAKDLRNKPMEINEDGNVSFFIKAPPNARKVILAGTFNHWDEDQIRMKKVAGGWTINLNLSPGIYEYKFIVDGFWTHDTNNPFSIPNEHQTLNSVLLVGDQVTFKLPGHLDAKEVILAGSFNNWDEKNMRMRKTANGWSYTVPLPPGKHYYKFIADGNWLLDPSNNLQQRDVNGNLNSVLLIH